MSTLHVFVIIVTLSSQCSAYVVSHSETDKSTASVLLKEGQSAEISCMTKGTGDYFWRKGENVNNSTLVAYFTVGKVIDDSQPYAVTENGTLHIRSVTLRDEGKYFCRASSTENECYGEVKILVQASLRNFDLAIDRCDGESSCLLYLDPSQSTSVTCTALNAPPSMTLKWFNGSKEIAEGIVQNELLPQNGNSREITSTLAAVYGHPASLTCQAVDPKRSNDDVRFAHAQVEMTVPFHETLPSWIIVAVTLAGCFIVFGIILLIKAMANRKQQKKYTKLFREEGQSLTETETDIPMLRREIVRLNTELKEKDNEMKTKSGWIQALMAEIELKVNQNRDEVITLNAKMEKKDKELSLLQAKMEKKDKELSLLQAEMEKKDKELSLLQVNVKTKDNLRIERGSGDQKLDNPQIGGGSGDQKLDNPQIGDVWTKDKTTSRLEEDVETTDEAIPRLEVFNQREQNPLI